MSKQETDLGKPTGRIVDLLASIAIARGAEGIFVIRNAESCAVSFVPAGETNTVDILPAIELAQPHEMVMVIRWAEGDGGKGGVESL